jgi:hypothetical protein
MTQAKELIGIAMLIDKMLFGAQDGIIGQEPIQDMNRFADGAGNHLGMKYAVLVGDTGVHRQCLVVVSKVSRVERAEERAGMQSEALAIGGRYSPIALDGAQRQAMVEIHQAGVGGFERVLP